MFYMSYFDESCTIGTASGYMTWNEPLMLSIDGQKLKISMTEEPTKPRTLVDNMTSLEGHTSCSTCQISTTATLVDPPVVI